MTVFEDIYRHNRWNGGESLSGPGSGTPATRLVAAELAILVETIGAESVLDYGCGDGFWMPDLPGYVGYDPTERAIERARINHPDRDYRSILPGGVFDLVIMRDVLQHLSFHTGTLVLARAKNRSRRWMILSHYVNGSNRDIADGSAYSPKMTAAPFSLPTPKAMIFDGYHYHEHGTDAVRDPGKYLGLWDIR